MPLIQNHRGADRFVPALVAFYAAQFAVIGVQIPYFPVWLDARGFDPATIGLVLGAPMVLRLAIVPVVGRLADRYGTVRFALAATVWSGLAAFILAALAEHSRHLLVLVVVALTLFGMTFPLTDAYALRGLAARGRAYGPVRMWGSASFIAANVAAGSVLSVIAPEKLIWLVIAAFGLLAMAVLALAPGGGPREVAFGAVSDAAAVRGSRLGGPWRLPAFLSAIVAASLVQASHAVYYGFSTIAWRDDGLGGTAIGLLWALGVLAEIALFAVSARLPQRIGAIELLVLGSLGAVVRWLAMALGPPTALLPALQVLHSLSFGATHLGVLQFIARTVPPRSAATAQADFSVLQGLVMAGAMAASGTLYRDYGSAAYAAMALLAAAGLGSALLARHRVGCAADVDR